MGIHNTKHVVTYIEYGDGADGRSRALGIYDTREEAEQAIEKDMDTYGESLGIYYSEDWGVWGSPDDKWKYGCAWNINEVTL